MSDALSSQNETRWCVDPFAAVLPIAGTARDNGHGYTVSSPYGLHEVEASPGQLRLLWSFSTPAYQDEIIAQFPFERADSRAFLQRCRQAGLLRPAGFDGRIVAPDRVQVDARFVGAPAFDESVPPQLTFLGIPFDGNTTGFPGARFGPQALRKASEGLRYLLDPSTQVPLGFYDCSSGSSLLPGVSLADAGDVHVSAGEDGPDLYDRVTKVVRGLLDAGTVPLIAGGDHSLTLPILAAYPEAPIQVVHLDAHADLGDIERGDETGLHHGNVFSVVLHQLEHVRHIRQLGLRGLMEGSGIVEHQRVCGVGMDVLRERGWYAALEGLDPALPTYVSIDIDVVDPTFAPSTGTPVPGGLFPHELKALLRAVAHRTQVVGVDVMEVGPATSAGDGTGWLAVEALLTLAGTALG